MRKITGLDTEQQFARYSQHERWGERIKAMSPQEFKNWLAKRLDLYLD